MAKVIKYGEDARKYRVIRQQKILSPIEKMKLAK